MSCSRMHTTSPTRKAAPALSAHMAAIIGGLETASMAPNSATERTVSCFMVGHTSGCGAILVKVPLVLSGRCCRMRVVNVNTTVNHQRCVRLCDRLPWSPTAAAIARNTSSMEQWFSQCPTNGVSDKQRSTHPVEHTPSPAAFCMCCTIAQMKQAIFLSAEHWAG